ncbi:hypothetical protein I3842_05G248900 [Carya illinoinensis]|uniref:Uncharacterized protein n=1 Tax=Carya illinoinensis TaxID=32201 RepID=A0A922F7K2_CARIL|nr:hypothetical protein I3842_05G248900 [Carya illinoinensis]
MFGIFRSVQQLIVLQMMYVTCESSMHNHDIYGREAPSSHSSSLAGDNHSSLTASLFLPRVVAQIRCLWPRVAADYHGESFCFS